MNQGADICANFFVTPDGMLAGEVFDRNNLFHRFVVELVVDDEIVALTRADLQWQSTFRPDGNDGRHGFVFEARSWWIEAQRIVARLANLGVTIGEIDGTQLRTTTPALRSPRDATGWVEWEGGLTLRGALAGRRDETCRVEVLLDRRIVAWVAVSPWLSCNDGRPFVLILPADLADGTPRRLEVRDQDGRNLLGSPVLVVAGAQARVEEALRRCGLADAGVLFEQFRAIADAEMPIGEYRRWRNLYLDRWENAQRSGISLSLRLGFVILGEDGADTTVASIGSLLGEETAIVIVEGDTAALAPTHPDLLAAAVAEVAADSDLVVCLPAGASLYAHAVEALRRVAAERDEALLLYWDIEIYSPAGPTPLFFTPFDGERLLEQGYACLAFAVTRRADLANGNYASFFHLVISLTRGVKQGSVGHIPSVLTALAPLNPEALTKSLRAALSSLYSTINVANSVPPRQLPALRISRQSVMTTTAILWGRWSDEEMRIASEVLRWQDNVNVSRIFSADSHQDEFAKALGLTPENLQLWSRSRQLNALATTFETDALLFLGPGIVPTEQSGLADLVGRLSAPRVAAVGPMLLTHRREVLSAGLALGPAGEVRHLWRGWPATARDPHDDLVVAHEVSGLCLDALVVDRRRFVELGGFDAERFPDEGADFDYCMRVREAGYRSLFTPHVPWIVAQGARSFAPTSYRSSATKMAERQFRIVWAHRLQDDSMHNPNLGRSSFPRSALALPPRSVATRWNEGDLND